MKMKEELAETTILESFIKNEESSANNAEVDEELNLLTHLLESHASQDGAAGPVSNLLNQLGVDISSLSL
jgi:hypothetical protein